MDDPALLPSDMNSAEQRRSSRTISTSQALYETPEKSKSRSPYVQSTSHAEKSSAKIESPVPPRKFRTRKSAVSNGNFSDPVEEAIKPLTEGERQSWKGWVELESDPALFSYILREYGVKYIKCQEVIALDDDSLFYLLKPVYGLIFLFKYRDNDADEDEDAPKCPDHVWFANQTTSNACATVALLNIVMNVPEVELGNSLEAFRETTRLLEPPYRGQALSQNDFIRNVHNSFLRRMDVLNADLTLQTDYEKWVKGKKNPKRKVGKKKVAKRKKEEDEAGYHFVAYVPINGSVWRLDGLQKRPVNLGEYGKDWVSLARDNIMQRIGQYQDGDIDYSLLSLCKSPLKTVQESVAENAHVILDVEKILAAVIPDWKLFTQSQSDQPISTDELMACFNISTDQIQSAEPLVSAKIKVEEAMSNPGRLLELYKDLVLEQKALRSEYMQELASNVQEDQLAAARKEDHTPVVYMAIKALAEAGVLKDIVRDLRGD
ncbi:cysteine proteinase [Hyaloscypha hepaticicola]|uniref:Ubiquitin carboxyl-terminal hydrolase n=1 Tax=Hyaloscypha hepaticicola TaxID=2082293 RepID=A0A2J6PJM9_9HELO|nr:cysteine proteinase [Hyaloscypha hepaticicola]